MQRYTVYLYLETALHVSGGTSTHHQERIQLYLQHLVFVTPLLLSAAIVEELEPVLVYGGWRTPPTAQTCICLTVRLFRITLVTVPNTHRTSLWSHAGAIDRYWCVYHVPLDEFRCFSKRYPLYALRKHICGSGLWKGLCCYAYRLYFLTCYMYKSSLKHIHDPVLSSLKMEGIRLLFNVGSIWELTPRPGRYTPGNARYPLYWRMGGPQGRYGRVRKITPPSGIQSPDLPARSESLYCTNWVFPALG
jgi:hypothetical protein